MLQAAVHPLKSMKSLPYIMKRVVKSSCRMCSEKVFLKISQMPLENAGVGISF